MKSQSKTLLFGTTNQAKLNFMRKILAGKGFRILGLSDMKGDIPVVAEDGDSPLCNAKLKALAYYNTFNIPTFSCDSGLYVEDVSDEIQIGVRVRNVDGKYLNDEEMINYYSNLVSKFGRDITVKYKNAICLVINNSEIYKLMDDSISGDKFILTNIPHNKRIKGFPLDSLSIDINTGKYYFDLQKSNNMMLNTKQGFCKFFDNALKNL